MPELIEKMILDCTCGSRSIWFDKNETHTLYCDRRQEHFESYFGAVKAHRTIHVEPDMIADFTNLPFEDNTFHMVVFDPPHIIGHNDGWMNKRYGDYPTKEDALESVSKGISECMRVLKPNGALIFKWAELTVTTSEILKRIDFKPLFGHRSGKKSNTHWLCFMKFAPTIEAEPVRHSRWVCVNEKENIWWCDECGGEIQFSEHTPESAGLVFCPRCGAKMNGGEEDG